MSIKALPSIFETKEIINKRVDAYIKGKHSLLTKAMQEKDPGREETKSVWYPKAVVQTWLEEIILLEGDGLRIYFGEKEVDLGDENDPEARYRKSAGQLCLIMIPTKTGSNDDSHVNIIYQDRADFTERQRLYHEEKNQGRVDMNFNFGGYCPPKCITEGPDFPMESVS
jgi:hypothetical protein